MKKYFPLFTLVLVSLTCTKQENCPRYFQIPAQIIPETVEYRIGDTITISSNFDKNVIGYNSNQNAISSPFDMSGIQWRPIFTVFKLDTIVNPANPKYSVITDFFDIISDTPVTDGISGSILFTEHNFDGDRFNLVIKIIPKSSGLFACQLSSQNHGGVTGQQDFPGKCRGNGFGVWVEMNNGAENNVDLLSEAIHPHWNDWVWQKSDDRFHRHGGYCFRVR